MPHSIEQNKQTLESMLDSIGPIGVQSLLAQICYEKADHIESNWQDKTLAKVWQRIAKAVSPDDRLASLSRMAGHKVGV